MTKGVAQKLLELRTLDLRAAENRCADLEAKVQLLEQDLKRMQERRIDLETRLYEAERLASRRFRTLRAIIEVVEAAQ